MKHGTVAITSDSIERLSRIGAVVDGRLVSDAGAMLDRETTSLVRELGHAFRGVLLVPPGLTRVEWPRDGGTPRVWMGDREITGLCGLIVRGTRGVEGDVHALAQGLLRAGCVLMDPLERFAGQRATKIIGTVDRWDAGVGTDTWVVGMRALMPFLDHAEAHALFPLLLKPLRGARGKGVRVLEDRRAADRALPRALRDADPEGEPLLFQRFVAFQAEWRVTVINGRSIGAVRRIAAPGVVTHNAATGASYEVARVPEIESLAERCHPGPGIVGVDIARAQDGSLHVIEGNWACEWGLFEDTTRTNVARAVTESLVELIDRRSESPLTHP